MTQAANLDVFADLSDFAHQGYQDTIDLPPCMKDASGCTPSKTKVRIPFVNPVITGVFVYHCHILGHEDRGMMQNIKVINPPLAAPVRDVF